MISCLFRFSFSSFLSESGYFNVFMLIVGQTGKYALRAEDFPRASKLPGAQMPFKSANSEKYTFQARGHL